jgi:SAM-dependent methyltransferase
VTVDHYRRSGERWAAGATLVYGPIAGELVALCGGPLEGRTVLDAGAGTGVVSAALTARGARPIAADFSYDMVSWHGPERPPAVVADICALPVADDAVDDTVAAFVLNHLEEPSAGFAELARVTRAGGRVLACVYGNANQSAARDRIDALARGEGWEVPEWYVEIKAGPARLLGSVAQMTSAAGAAGLIDIRVEERAVDVGVTEPHQLVDYRFGQAQFAGWLDAVGDDRARDIKHRIAEAIRPIMSPYCPLVVFLSAAVRSTVAPSA